MPARLLVPCGLLALALALGAACGDETSSGAGPAGIEDAGAPYTDAGAEARDGAAATDLGSPPQADAGGADEGTPDAGERSEDAGPDPTEALFDPTRLLRVELELDPGDWDTLRFQRRTIIDIIGPGCMEGPAHDPFTWFEAAVTVDGTRLERVGLRKKGFLGSLSDTKPSLKLKMDRYVDGQRLAGAERMTLNNNRQDPSHLHQCLGYELFRAAGLPAARCSFASVAVNGVELGIYTHLDSIKKPFLRRWFADDEGALYEGALSDFRPAWTNTFERKTNEDQADRSDLQAVVDALDAPDAELLQRLDAVIDVEQFLTFWAAEALVAHWDGYAGNRNNFYLYRDPAQGRFVFIPWGIDGAFRLPAEPPGRRSRPESVFGAGLLAYRLYALEASRARYMERLRWLLDTVWDEAALLAEIDRVVALLQPALTAAEAEPFLPAVEQVRQFVRGRYLDLHTEMALGPAWLPYPPAEEPCWLEAGHVSVGFDTRWGTHPAADIFRSGSCVMNAQYAGQEVRDLAGGAAAGIEPEGHDAGRAVLLFLSPLPDGGFIALQVLTNPRLIQAERPVALDWGETVAVFFYLEPGWAAPQLLGYVGGGALRLDIASTEPGGAVVGRVEGTLLAPPQP